ncbi:MAG: hypothetical protein H2057_04270 [Alphaproteobacteria bacterium]|nr:hypothetical protein [Alphaproteobacteria bacterium]
MSCIKKVLFVLFFISPFQGNASAQEENTSLTPEIIQHIPKGWRFVDLAQGPLRAYGAVDAVLVIEKAMEKLEDTVSDDEERTLPEIPRRLLVLFKEENEYRISFSSDKLLPAYPNLQGGDDFFRGVEIKRGSLKIRTGYVLTLGSWWCSLHKHVFRFEEESKRFRLVGSTHELFHKACGDAEERSVNYLTHKMKIKKVESVFDDPPSKPKVTWYDYPGVWCMDDIHDLNTFGEQFN